MFKIWKYEDIICARGSRTMPWNRSSKMHVYYYLIDNLLIDTGPFSLKEQAVKFFDTNTIEQVFLTHIHEDHAGMAYWLQENKKVPIYLHPCSIEHASLEPELKQYRLEIWGKRQKFKAEPVPDTINTSRYTFQVIDSPGHCRHHKILHEERKGWLFSGDLITSLKPKSVFCEENMTELICSIKKILTLDFHTVFCTHTGILENGRELFSQKLNYLLQLQKQVRNLRYEGFSDREIDQQLFPGPDPVTQLTEGEFSSYFIVNTL